QPLTVNPAPLMAACAMVTLPVPLFVTVIVCVALLPTRALPKLRLLVLTESRYVCVGAGATPVPVTVMVCVAVSPSGRMKPITILPLKLCAAFGWKTTCKDTRPPPLSVMGSAGLETINSARLLDTCMIETLRRLLLVTTRVSAALCVFTATDPKLSELGETPTVACTGTGHTTNPAKINPTTKHTNSVLFMDRQPFVFFLERGEGGWGPGERRSRFLYPVQE